MTTATTDPKAPTRRSKSEPVTIGGVTLRVPQVRILKALAKSPGGLSRPEIAIRAKVSLSMTANLGPIDPHAIDAVDGRYGKRCLLGLRLVRCEVEDRKGRDVPVYSITARGRKALGLK